MNWKHGLFFFSSAVNALPRLAADAADLVDRLEPLLPLDPFEPLDEWLDLDERDDDRDFV